MGGWYAYHNGDPNKHEGEKGERVFVHSPPLIQFLSFLRIISFIYHNSNIIWCFKTPITRCSTKDTSKERQSKDIARNRGQEIWRRLSSASESCSSPFSHPTPLSILSRSFFTNIYLLATVRDTQVIILHGSEFWVTIWDVHLKANPLYLISVCTQPIYIPPPPFSLFSPFRGCANNCSDRWWIREGFQKMCTPVECSCERPQSRVLILYKVAVAYALSNKGTDHRSTVDILSVRNDWSGTSTILFYFLFLFFFLFLLFFVVLFFNLCS